MFDFIYMKEVFSHSALFKKNQFKKRVKHIVKYVIQACYFL